MRRLLVLAGVGLVGALLSGCAGESGGQPGEAAPSAAPSASPSPSHSGAPSAVPSASAGGGAPTSLKAWGDAALPPSKPGGSKAVIREFGAVTPATRHRAEIGQDAGAWVVQIACESAAGTPITYRLVASREEVAHGEVACGATGQVGAGNTTVALAGGADTQLELTAEADAIFVYEVSPGAAIEN